MLTVTTPATGTPAGTEFDLITVATARSAMGIVDQTEDAALQGFVTRASDVIARHCRRVFALETVEETLRAESMQAEIILSRYPVAEITSIVENGSALVVTDYEIDKATGIITRLSGDRPCYWSPSKITVVYSTGYDLPSDTPPALQQACVQLVKSYYLSADRDPMVRSESSEAISSASYFSNGGSEHLPPDVRALLNQFRNLRTR